MNNYIFLRIENITKEKVVNKFASINVSIFDLHEKNEKVYVKILEEDLIKIQKYLKTLEWEVFKEVGFHDIKKKFKQYKLYFILFLISFSMVVFISRFIVDVQIIHDDEKLVNLLKEELESYGIDKFTYKKSFDYLEKVKNEIKTKHADKIDWLEIKKDGMRYIVSVEERIIKVPTTEESYCHVYSTKDGLITKIKSYSGENVITIGDYVKSGSLLISGDIHLNENVVDNVCARGEVYAESWYTVNITVPFVYYETKTTGKKRNNYLLEYKDTQYKIFKDRLNIYESSQTTVFDLFGIKIIKRKDEEIKKIAKKYTEEEALNEAIRLAKEKVEMSIKDKGEVISQKVLQKHVNDSTIEVEMFIVAEELISISKVAKVEEKNDL